MVLEWYAICVILLFEKQELMQLHVGGVGGIRCQHLLVRMAQLLQEHWEWQEKKKGRLAWK